MFLIKGIIAIASLAGTAYGAFEAFNAVKSKIKNYRVLSKRELEELENQAAGHQVSDEEFL